MTEGTEFLDDLEREVKKQLRSQRVGYLLGAGSSYLSEVGYPLAAALWQRIAEGIPEEQREQIQAKLNEGAVGIEEALDRLDDGGATETVHRRLATNAIAEHFASLNPPLDTHVSFVTRIAARGDSHVPVYSLNYDPLVERAADSARIRLTDGFHGIEAAYFDGSVFGEAPYAKRGSHKTTQLARAPRPIQLLKLHGSLGWYDDQRKDPRRCGFTTPIPAGTRRLMVPPQRRKAAETTHPPYSALWSRFRGSLAHDDMPLNRLVCIGYGFGDHHVNEVVAPAMGRGDFTLLIFAKSLSDDTWEHWAAHDNAIVVTEARCSLFGQTGDGHSNLWDFERLAREV